MKGVERYTVLETLKIDCCKLDIITDEIGFCTELVTLEAHKNNISSISSNENYFIFLNLFILTFEILNII